MEIRLRILTHRNPSVCMRVCSWMAGVYAGGAANFTAGLGVPFPATATEAGMGARLQAACGWSNGKLII